LSAETIAKVWTQIPLKATGSFLLKGKKLEEDQETVTAQELRTCHLGSFPIKSKQTNRKQTKPKSFPPLLYNTYIST